MDLSGLILALSSYKTTTFNCSSVGGLKAKEMKIIGSTDHRLALRHDLLI